MKRFVYSFLLISSLFACEEEDKTVELNWGSGDCAISTTNDFPECLKESAIETLDVFTWNLKFFPLDGDNTMELVAEIITNSNPDIIALQEINSIGGLIKLSEFLPAWHAEYVELSGDLELGFLYKVCEITEYTKPKKVATDVWPRPGVETTISHISGLKLTLINVHLKCCGGEDNFNTRKASSLLLKSHIDSEHPEDAVILLGDYNDVIIGDHPFINFSEDVDNYAFTDLDIANGSADYWSYPSWPSHIDHIVVTNELFDKHIDTAVLPLDGCVPAYSDRVSDHRPVLIRLGQ